MTMKTILIPSEQHEMFGSILATAELFARRFDSYMEGLAAWPSFASFVAVDPMGAAAIPRDTWQDAELANKTRAAFESFMKERGIAAAGTPRKGLSYGWSEGEPVADSFVASRGRVFDITVVGRPSSTSASPRMSTLEAALFESGRPILIAPPQPPTSLGDNVVIAWNQSSETARTVALAMPILAKAKQVTVLTIEGGIVPGPTGRELADMLTVNGIAANELTKSSDGASTGQAILANAAELGADLIVKGAYTQSRIRQMIFGGATSHLLWATELPIFMAN
ncbi:MAG: universal stress protein [Hyphomicrobiaceae bacterium]|nr:universal stress protein [Hyphomicrobiaceae bacterium]